MTERIVIDTDDLRELTRTLQGALQQLGDIKLDLIRASADLHDDAVAFTSYQQLLAGIEILGTTITDDHANLATEVLALEAEEGAAPALTTTPAPAAGVPTTRPWWFALQRSAFTDVSAPPQPWDQPWVNPDGTMPPQPGVAASAGFGATWEARGSFDSGGVSGSGKASASAGGWAYGEAEGGQDADGNYHGTVKAGAGVEAHAHVEGEISAGPITASGELDARVQAKAEAEASGSIGPDGIKGSVSVSAEASAEVEAQATVGVDGLGDASGHAEAEAEAKVHGEANAEVGSDGIAGGVGAGAMAGASAGAGYSVDGPGGTHVGVGVNVKTGVGVEVGASGELSWEKVGFTLDIGVALGVGAGISLDISFSPEAIVDAFSDAADWIGEAASDVADATSDFFDPPPADQLLDNPAAGVTPEPVTDPAAGAPASTADLPESLRAALERGTAALDAEIPLIAASTAVEHVATAAADFLRAGWPVIR